MMSDTNTSAADLVERLRNPNYARSTNFAGAYMNEAADTIERLTARLARAEAALEPFAKAAEIKLCGEWSDDERINRTDVAWHITFGHLRAARAYFASAEEQADAE